ncbi:hypothetical protein [Alteribacillus bidgolensis]|uniref:Transcriptional regulator n=1 Tax=Alteribacillus bidgolensis TaxID=930129 RepID=A0A1G8IDY9_9BACI|nr:hypothetical protein [Alteribacillus bidgolensis]SDI17017.1 hypothetical protein SAMN05216352_105150 [Alteribacillus bidgolensis]
MRAGIVGPQDIVDSIIKIINDEFKQTILAVPFIYKKPSETTSIINDNYEYVDVWIFSGPGLYPFAEESKSKQPFFYLLTDGFSLIKTLMEIGYNDQKNLSRLSIDFLTEKNVIETYKDLGLPTDHLGIKEYSSSTPLEEYLLFHENMYQSNKVDICVTALRFIYEELKRKNIPVYRILPSRTNIRENLQAALQKWDADHSKKSQIAILFIKVKKKKKQMNYQEMNYDTNRLELKLEDLVLSFAEDISGSFVPVGMGTFIAFSTRGSLSEKQYRIEELLNKCALLINLPMNIGIGYGESTLNAEENARSALYYSQNYGPFSAFIVDSNGRVDGPLNNPEDLIFEEKSTNEDIMKKLRKCNVTLSTFHKIMTLQKQLNNESITSLDISTWMQMTERNARRILSELVEAELALVIGSEPSEKKGRPRNKYRLNLK